MYQLLNDRRADGIGTIELLYDENALFSGPFLRITLDGSGREIFQPVPREKAMDAFVHPFAYIDERIDLDNEWIDLDMAA